MNTWKIRSEEGFASTFWCSLSGVDETSISKAEEIGKYCAEKEYMAGELVAKRQDEYLIEPSWLIKNAEKVGFKVIINQPINTLADRIILLQK